jgi:hypothetical protein
MTEIERCSKKARNRKVEGKTEKLGMMNPDEPVSWYGKVLNAQYSNSVLVGENKKE